MPASFTVYASLSLMPTISGPVNGGLQRPDLFRARRRPLQEHDDEMARIALGLRPKKKCPVPLCYVQEAVFRTRRYR
jgi:hypothetical protein